MSSFNQNQKQVVAVRTVSGGGHGDDALLPGDIIDQIRVIGKMVLILSAPFPGGKAAVQKELRKIYQANESLVVRVRRGQAQEAQDTKVEVNACVVSEENAMRRKKYLLASLEDRKQVATLMNASESECFILQAQTQHLRDGNKKALIESLPLRDCLISYSWKQKMEELLPTPTSSMVFSVLVMPYQPNPLFNEFNEVEDTIARAMAWLTAVHRSGVPITFVNIQTEPFLVQAAGSKYFGAGGVEDLVSIVNAGKYSLQDLEGAEINVVRSVRVWYVPAEGELSIELRLDDGETRLGVNITCTEEGFCYVSSVDHGTPADRGGLREILNAARSAGKLLVVSRVAGEKVTPSMITPSGGIRCFDMASISQRLMAHRQAREMVRVYFMVWNVAAKSLKLAAAQSYEDPNSRYLQAAHNRISSSSDHNRVSSSSDNSDHGRRIGTEQAKVDQGSGRASSTFSLSGTALRGLPPSGLPLPYPSTTNAGSSDSEGLFDSNSSQSSASQHNTRSSPMRERERAGRRIRFPDSSPNDSSFAFNL